MPKVAYSEEDRQRIRSELVKTGLELMSRQGVQHTTVEQIYKKVGISRTFFYSFFPAKEDLIVEALYLQQPRVLEYARKLMNDPGLSLTAMVIRRAVPHTLPFFVPEAMDETVEFQIEAITDALEAMKNSSSI